MHYGRAAWNDHGAFVSFPAMSFFIPTEKLLRRNRSSTKKKNNDNRRHINHCICMMVTTVYLDPLQNTGDMHSSHTVPSLLFLGQQSKEKKFFI